MSRTFTGMLPCQPINLVLGSYNVPQTQSNYSLEAGLVSYLTSRPDIAALVGNRLYAHQVARTNTTWPVITYYRNSTEHKQGLSGSLGYVVAHVDIDVWSTVYIDVVSVAHAIRMALQGWHSGYWGCVPVLSVALDDESDSVEKPADGSGNWWYSRSLDYTICFIEQIPRF